MAASVRRCQTRRAERSATAAAMSDAPAAIGQRPHQAWTAAVESMPSWTPARPIAGRAAATTAAAGVEEAPARAVDARSVPTPVVRQSVPKSSHRRPWASDPRRRASADRATRQRSRPSHAVGGGGTTIVSGSHRRRDGRALDAVDPAAERPCRPAAHGRRSDRARSRSATTRPTASRRSSPASWSRRHRGEPRTVEAAAGRPRRSAGRSRFGRAPDGSRRRRAEARAAGARRCSAHDARSVAAITA